MVFNLDGKNSFVSNSDENKVLCKSMIQGY
jgi:hypothetical protein